MRNLGLLYYAGHGVAPDYAKAREWYEKAAENGDAVAMSNLGLLYANGQGVAQDYVEARKWYEKAAENGDAGAMTNLGALYGEGRAWRRTPPRRANGMRKPPKKANPQQCPTLARSTPMVRVCPRTTARRAIGLRRLPKKATRGACTTSACFMRMATAWRRTTPRRAIWFEKAADKGDAAAKPVLENLSILEAEEPGHYAEALQLVQARAAKEEAVDTERDGMAGKQTAHALNEVAWYALLAREFTQALSAADRAHALLPDDLEIDTNRAHALMFLGRGEESEALYLAHKGERVSDEDRSLWERVIAKDFADLRKAGLTHPMMVEIEKKLGVSP